MPTVNDWEGSDVLFYLKANKLACYAFKDASRGHKIPGSETKDFITNGASSSLSFTFIVSPSSQPSLLCDAKQPRWMLCTK